MAYAAPVPRQYGRQRARGVVNSQRAMDLWVHHGMSYREIARELGLKSPSYVGALVRGGLQRAQRQHDELAHLGLQRTLKLLDLALSEAYEVVTRVCPQCHGHGTRNSRPCKRCDGTGLWYDVVERRRWIDRLLKTADQRSKLLGEYAPTDHRLVDGDGEAVSIREILVAMSPDEVAREAGFYLQGVDDARGADDLPPAVTTTDEGAHAAD